MRRIFSRAVRFRVRALRGYKLLCRSNRGGHPWTRLGAVCHRAAQKTACRTPRSRDVERTPATVEHYDFPSSFPPYFRRTKAFDERRAYRLRDVMVSANSGLVWLPRGPVLAESYGSFTRMLSWGDVRAELLTKAKQLKGSIIPFPEMPYYHWLLEIVPAALFSLSVSPESSLLLPRAATWVRNRRG